MTTATTDTAVLLTPPMPPYAPDGVGGLGVLAALRRNGFGAFPRRCLREPVIRLWMPGRALILASSPEAIREVLQTRAADFRRLSASQRILGPVVGRGLLTSEGEAWRRQRKAMAPAFTPRTVPVLAAHISRCAEAACSALEERGTAPVDLLAAMQQLALEIASVTMFSLEAEHFGAELRAMVTGYMTGIGRPVPSDFLIPPGWPTPLSWRRARFRRRWRALIDRIVAARRARDASEGGARDLYDMIAAAYGRADDNPGADDLVADEVATMIVAGHETTALVLFWALFLLAQAPDWQTAIATEARPLDLAPDGAGDSLAQLPVTRAVVQEALRLYPPAFMTAREASRRTRICDMDVPAGAVVLAPLFLLHRDPRLWNAPGSFDPRRFLGETEPDRATFLPFGAGPHVCIGAQLAMTEAVLVLARLLRGSRVELLDHHPITPIGVLSTRPDRSPGFALHTR